MAAASSFTPTIALLFPVAVPLARSATACMVKGLPVPSLHCRPSARPSYLPPAVRRWRGGCRRWSDRWRHGGEYDGPLIEQRLGNGPVALLLVLLLHTLQLTLQLLLRLGGCGQLTAPLLPAACGRGVVGGGGGGGLWCLSAMSCVLSRATVGCGGSGADEEAMLLCVCGRAVEWCCELCERQRRQMWDATDVLAGTPT